MEPAPIKTGLFSDLTSCVKSTAWVQWFTKLVNKPALDSPGNATLFLRGDDSWQIPGGFVPGAHANSHSANGSDSVTLSQSQTTNLTSDLANKVDQTLTINTTNGLTGGGSLVANRTLEPVYGSAGNTVCEGDDNRLVTGGNNHVHANGDGGTIDHNDLANIGNNTHAQIDTYMANLPTANISTDIDFTTSNSANATISLSKTAKEVLRGRLYIDADPGAHFDEVATFTFYNKTAKKGEDAFYRTAAKLVYAELVNATTGSDANIIPDDHTDFSPNDLVTFLDDDENSRLKTIASTMIAEDTVGSHAANTGLVRVAEFSGFTLYNLESGTDVYLNIAFSSNQTVSLKMNLIVRG